MLASSSLWNVLSLPALFSLKYPKLLHGKEESDLTEVYFYLLSVFQEPGVGTLVSETCRQVWEAEVPLWGCLERAPDVLPLGDSSFALQVGRLDRIPQWPALDRLLLNTEGSWWKHTGKACPQGGWLQGSLLCPHIGISGVCHRLM